MVHKDIWRNGKKLVTVTQIPKILAAPYLDQWRLKLCQCVQHSVVEKTPFKEAEIKALEMIGPGCCGHVYAEKVADIASELGTNIHEEIEAYFSNQLPEYSMWATKVIEHLQFHNVKPVIIQPEEVLIDQESGLSGSPDMVVEWDGRTEIADLKIKNSLDPLSGFQGMGYRYLIRRLKGADIKWMRLIWCQKESKDKTVNVNTVIDLDLWEKPWKSLVEVFNIINPKRKVTIIE